MLFGIFELTPEAGARLLGNGMPLFNVLGRLSTILVEFCGVTVVVEEFVRFGKSGGRITELRRLGLRGGIRGG